MSPAQRRQPSDIDRVAVIGAGPSGLAAAKYLLAENKFSTVDVFEQHTTVGGVWAYTPGAEDSGCWVSPVYDLLETNIAHTLMQYTDLDFPADSALFPRHEVVKRYLDAYAEPLGQRIKLSTQVVSVQKVENESRDVWEVQTRRRCGSDGLSTAYYDAVVVANGHYSEAFTPCVPGLDAFGKAHPGLVSHSKQYRRPGLFEDKKVVVIGNSASGVDISAQISTTAKLPVIISEKDRRSEPALEESAVVPSWAKRMPQIVEFIPERRCARFANGEVETDIDAVVFCTGYVYRFPFLKGLGSVSDGACVRGLYQHVFCIDDPTLAFLGIPQRIVPFPFAEGQAAWIARVWAGRLGLPPTSEMRAWETALAEEGNAAALHSMGALQDVDYINEMHRLSQEAERDGALENGGLGKMPPFWGDDKRWLRAQMPLVKAASRKFGGERHKLRDLAALGFVYPDQSAGSPQVDP